MQNRVLQKRDKSLEIEALLSYYLRIKNHRLEVVFEMGDPLQTERLLLAVCVGICSI